MSVSESEPVPSNRSDTPVEFAPAYAAEPATRTKGRFTAGELRRRTARGALTSVVGQAGNFVLRIGSMVILARLVTPEHFGLVGMVTAFTGFLGLFRDAGLAQATVQRETLSEELRSTMFWINLGVGVLLSGLMLVAAPFIARFYGDPRLFWIAAALGTSFIFNGAAAQHRAHLQRNMRFGLLTTIDLLALVASIVLGAWMGWAGFGYWSLVAMAVSVPATAFVGIWIASGWKPRAPGRAAGARAMVKYGGVVTLNSLVVYVAYNADKVLLGRFWGAEILGFYGRAYQLISIPTENLHATIGWVMFPALSRVQSEPQRLRNYFLTGYGLFLSVVMPVTVACAMFAEDIVRVLLGEQWGQSVPVFRLLAPTIAAFALINPFAYLMQACGHAVRSLKLSLLIAPVVVFAYLLALPYGAQGVAVGFSVAMMSLVVPVVLVARRGTLITPADLLLTVGRPLLATMIGAAAAFLLGPLLGETSPFLRLTVLASTLFAVHFVILLFVLGQKSAVVGLLHAAGLGGLVSRPAVAHLATGDVTASGERGSTQETP